VSIFGVIIIDNPCQIIYIFITYLDTNLNSRFGIAHQVRTW